MVIIEMNREELFHKAFERKENVCSHIHQAKDKNSLQGMPAFPLCVQIYEDGYHLYWYCSKCVEEYGLSEKGTYVFDAEDRFKEIVNRLDNFEIGDDPDANPFSNFLDEQKGFMLTLKDFSKLKVTFDPDKPITESNLMHVPFGAEFIK